jgi:general L-amino acid transport system permease protein
MFLSGRNTRFLLQAALVAVVLAIFAALAKNVAANLQRQALHFGFDFLSRPAGFTLLQSLIPFDEHSTFGRAFVAGLLNTLLAAIIGIVLATVIGFGVGVARLVPNRPLRWVAASYVELFRNLPLLLLLFFFYFGVLRQLPPPRQSYVLGGVYLNNRGLFLPSVDLWGNARSLVLLAILALAACLFLKGRSRAIAAGGAAVGILLAIWSWGVVSWPEPRGLSVAGGVKLIPEFIALVAALSIYTAAYIAEIVRAGIEAVPGGQREAAESLGMTGWQATRLVIIPQALRLVIPPLTSQYLNLTKNSSLAVAIAYPDLVSVFAGTTLAQTGQAIEIMAITMGVYLALSLLTAAISNWYNARVRG